MDMVDNYMATVAILFMLWIAVAMCATLFLKSCIACLVIVLYAIPAGIILDSIYPGNKNNRRLL